jgi:hypothetical protein
MNDYSHPPSPLARNSDPDTSHAAAEASSKFSHIHYGLIVNCLKNYGPLGKDGIARITNMNGRSDGNAVARRMIELQRMGYIVLTGNKVKSISGCDEREWVFNLEKLKE